MWKSMVAMPFIVLAFSQASLTPAKAEDSPEDLLKASQDCVGAHSVELRQALEQTGRLLLPGKPPVEIPAKKQTSTIEIDAANKLIRMTTKVGEKDLVVIRKGERVAIKIGAEPWQKPAGAYAAMAPQLANPFACPLPKADRDSPKWAIAGRERFEGQETTMIETVGDTANKYALERMREGLVNVFPDSTKRPTIELLAYKSRHWIGKDHRLLRVEQTSHHKLTMPGSDKLVIDTIMKTTTVYRRYDKVELKVPEEARGILDLR